MAKEKKKTKPSKRWNLFQKSGEKLERKNKSCPKCGQGTFMAKHSNRDTCGTCSYTEFTPKA